MNIKTKKLFLHGSFMLFVTGLAWAQKEDVFTEEIVIPLSQPDAIGTLEVNQIYGGMTITGYEGREVIIVAQQKKMQTTQTMKNGLRRINNSSLALQAEESNNYIEVESHNYSGGKNQSMNLEIKVPHEFNLKLNSINDGAITISQVSGDMEVSNVNDDITLNQVSGSAVIDSVNGEIKATFDAITAGSLMAFTSFNGDVDLSLPAAVKADFKMRTMQGEIFTGFDIDFDTSAPVVDKETSGKSYKVKLEKWVTGTANGGGTEIILKSHMGDLILRSQD
ncbi:hypothetical protein OS175_08840 [Marinicella sp. S1101]|uniref:DUF4097 family beta strand repeat-containing protein n=1 Tax=Marinicella marina TaxID=2996016 RepID=UPI002260A9D1|nr:DUF4097 family beta strand repeat-containing protein [Marinicella marina]MCX7553982.1 hypothetical protein [Marinicella marina]MDJ1140475.1 hypothetical protein [Marinicella marina]